MTLEFSLALWHSSPSGWKTALQLCFRSIMEP